MRNNEDRLSGLAQQAEVPQQTNNLSFVVPTEYVDLPTKGKFYPVGHPLYGKTSVEIKQMTAKEEDILTSESYIKKGIVLEKYLESIIVDKSIRPELLTVSDRSAIFLAARILAYGPEYKVGVSCPKCAKEHELVYDLISSPKVQQPEEEAVISQKGTFFIELPSTKWAIECRALFGKDENKTEEKNKLMDNNVSNQLLSFIVGIKPPEHNAVVEDKKLIEQAVLAMPAKDSRFLRSKYKSLIPTVKFSLDLECSCDNKTEVEVPITLEFFWPKS